MNTSRDNKLVATLGPAIFDTATTGALHLTGASCRFDQLLRDGEAVIATAGVPFGTAGSKPLCLAWPAGAAVAA